MVLSLAVSDALAQDKPKQKSSGAFCSTGNLPSDNKISVKEMREITIPAPSLLTVEIQQHGSISVKKSNRSDVLVRACVIAAGSTEGEARAFIENIRIESGSVIKAVNTPREGWMVSYEIYVPNRINIKLLRTRR